MALAAGVFAAWVLLHAGWPVWPAAAVAGLAGALAWQALRADPVDLVWDGQSWRGGGLDLMLDFGGWMLLRQRPEAPARPRWIAVSPAEAGAALHGLRAALYARVPPPGPPPGATRSG
jgi:hypothetical protein